MTASKVTKFPSNEKRLAHHVARPVTTAADDANGAVNTLWAKYVALVAQAREIREAMREAEARLPEWAQPGPGYLAEDGTLTGKVVKWPVDLSIQPVRGVLVPVRLSHKNLKDYFEQEVSKFPTRRAEGRGGAAADAW